MNNIKNLVLAGTIFAYHKEMHVWSCDGAVYTLLDKLQDKLLDTPLDKEIVDNAVAAVVDEAVT